MDYCDRNVEFYHKRLQKAGVTADKIKSLKDVRHIPVTTKEDIRDTYPFGLFAQPMKNIVRVHASSGTTGKPTVVGYTKKDLDTWSDLVARLCVAAGASDEDIVQISFGYGLFTGALGLHYGLEKIGATVVPYALHMSEVAHEHGITNDQLQLRLGLFGSEGCTPEMRDQIEKSFGVFATDNSGMSELMGPGVSGECELRCGMHIAEDHFLPEIVNPDTLEPMGEGETGELIITTLTKEGFPMLRYRTKDLTTITYEPCACGRTHARMEKIKGRSDDMLKIHIGGHYELVIRREGYRDTLEVRVELINGDLLEHYGELEALRNSIHAQLKTVLGIESKVTLCEPKTLERYQGKAKRIIDLREQK